MSVAFCLVFLLSGVTAARHHGAEPECSRYDFAEKTLEKLVRVEHAAELREQEQRKWEDRLQTTLTAISDERSETGALVKKLEGLVKSVETKLQEKEAEWDNTLRQKLDEYESTIQSFIEGMKQPKMVVFKAKVVKDKSIAAGQILVYADVVINVGDGYDVTTGYFTTPVPGSYMFTCQLCASSSNWAHVRMVVNGSDALETTSFYSSSSSSYGTCTTLTGVAVLTTGDTVSIKGISSGTLTEDSWRWNSFSGILIHET